MIIKKKSKIILLLILIIILGTLLRFHDLGKESLWTDEIISLKYTEYNLGELIELVTITELTPPGYFIFLSYWVKIFGNSEFSLRMPSTISDIFSIFLIFLIGSKLFNKKVGLIAAFLLSTTMLQIVYAQEARNFATFGFLSLLSTLFLINHYKNKKLQYKIAYIITMSISMYFNYMTSFLIVFHFLTILLLKKKKFLKDFLQNIFIIILLFVPGLKILLIQGALRHKALKISLIQWGVPTFLSKLGVVFFLLPLIILLICFVFVFIVYKKFDFLKSKKKQLILMISFNIIMFIGYLVYLNKFMRSFALVRHSFFVISFFYILVALIISMIKSKKIKTIVIIIILLINITTITVYYQKTTKAPWDDAIFFIQNNSPKNTLILFDRANSNIELFKYYHKDSFHSLNLTWTKDRELHQIVEEELFDKLKKEDRFWLISSRNVKTKDYYINLLVERYDLLLSQKYQEMEIYYFSVE